MCSATKNDDFFILFAVSNFLCPSAEEQPKKVNIQKICSITIQLKLLAPSWQ